MSFDQIVPARRRRVLEIGHVDIGAAIQRVDHHLAVGRAGDLDAAVLDVARDRCHPPVAVADRLGLGQEIGLPPGIEPALDVGASSEKPPPLRTEFALELGDEGNCRRGQHLLIAGLQLTANDKVLHQIVGFGHSRHLPDGALHLPSTATVTRSAPTSQNRLQAFLSVIPLDLFALIRSRSTGAAFLDQFPPALRMMQCNIAAVNRTEFDERASLGRAVESALRLDILT